MTCDCKVKPGYDLLCVNPDHKVNKTGTYKWDPEKGEMVKISDRAHVAHAFDCYVPEGGYYSDNLGTFVESRAHKRRLMKEQNVKEASNLTVREL